jgi:hypothetical protein
MDQVDLVRCPEGTLLRLRKHRNGSNANGGGDGV